MTYFATKQKIDESRFLQRFYCKGPEHFVRFLFPSEPYFISLHELFQVRDDLRKEAGEGFEVHIYKTSIPRDKFDSSRAWDYIIDDRAELLLY
jgi:hypothetical protein